MQLKKIGIVFLVVVVMLSCVGAFALAQEAPASLDLSVEMSAPNKLSEGDKLIVKPGDIVRATIKVGANPGIGAIQLYFNYDSTAVEYVKHYEGKVFSKNGEGADWSVDAVSKSGEVMLLVINDNLVASNVQDSVIVTFEFTVLESYDGNIEGFELSDDILAYDGNFASVDYNITKNGETVYAHEFGASTLIPGDCETANKEEFTCVTCGEKVVSTVGTPIGHDNKTLVERVPATCVTTGFEEHFRCAREECGQYFAVALDENGDKVPGDKVSYEDLVLPSDNGHLYVFVPEVPADCENDGKEAHYICERESCGQLAQKPDGSDEYIEVSAEDIVISAMGHDYISVELVEPLCEVEGKKAHYTCSACPKLFVEVSGEKVEATEAQLVIPALEHVPGNVVEYKAPTAAEFGFKAHSLCTRECGQYFDANSNKTTYEELLIDKLPPEIQEADDSWVKGDPNSKVEFKSDAHIDDFKDFWFNGQKLVKDKDYTVREGSIIVTLTDSFLATLEPGKTYDVGIESTSGTAATTFKVTHAYGELVGYKNATCTANGNLAYYYCGAACCNTYFDADKNIVASGVTEIPASLVIKALGHKPAGAKIPASDPTCTDIGYMLDCFKCSVCDGYYKMNDDGSFTDYPDSAIEIPALGHDVVKVDAKAPTCEDKGNIEHYLCKRCNCTLDENNVVIDPVLAAKGHTYGELIAEVPATCETTGKIAYYECSVCNKTFNSEKVEVTDLVIPAKGHTYGELIAEVPATCETTGKIAHYKCSVCNKTFDASKKEVTNLVIPAKGHNYGSLIAEVPATCETAGKIAYYECSVCKKTFNSEKVEVTDLVIPAKGHNYGELIAEVPATCETAGTIAHYKCSVCEKTFNSEKVEVTDLVIPAKGHTYGELIAEVPATTEKDGAVAHYLCSECGKYFNEGKTEIASIVIPKLPKITSAPEESTWTKGGDESLVFVSDAKFEEFVNVKINNVLLGEGGYKLEKAEDGSTRIILEPAYLEQLDAADYTISITSENGSCDASFTVENSSLALTIVIVVIAVVVLVAGVTAAIVVLKKKNRI